ncbi:MAG: hypothetical protein K1X92_00135 [Bacteroidia bacterium]|nr:hypothetical protein [Bacteroidia bacterium]
MKTDFYLLNHSFRYQEGISLSDLEERLKHLATDYDYIRQYKDRDKVRRHESIYEEVLFGNDSVMDILYNGKLKGVIDRDAIEALRTIIDKSEADSISSQEVIERLLQEHSQEQVYGLLCLHPIDNVPKEFLVYNKYNWLSFHRYFLGVYPKNVAFYFQECKKYFPELHFHERNETTINTLFDKFTKKIIEHLSHLHDSFNNCKTDPYNRVETLKRFSVACDLDEEASNEGDASRKKAFTFSFENNRGVFEEVCCEPHLKLCRSDAYPGDAEYYFYRIYFHEGKTDKDTNIANGKILIGHIGKHL